MWGCGQFPGQQCAVMPPKLGFEEPQLLHSLTQTTECGAQNKKTCALHTHFVCVVWHRTD